MGDFDFGSWGPSQQGVYSRHQKSQGFRPPVDESPFSTPSGWYGGAVRQTGGMIMVREWGTVPGANTPHTAREKHRKHEYEIAYGDTGGVSINRYKWIEPDGYADPHYEWDGVVDEIPVPENTDEAKAKAARKLMKKHSGKTR